MEPDAEARKGWNQEGGQVCQICNGVGAMTMLDGELFVENQCCPQCRTNYKRHQGSLPVLAEKTDDEETDDAPSDYNYPSGNQDQKQKLAERTLAWHANNGRRENNGYPKYDSGGSSPSSIPSSAHSRMGYGQHSGEHLGLFVGYHASFRSDSGRWFDGRFRNAGWKEGIDGWRLKQDNSVEGTTNGTSTAPPSEGRGVGDVESTVDYSMDDARLWVPF